MCTDSFVALLLQITTLRSVRQSPRIRSLTAASPTATRTTIPIWSDFQVTLRRMVLSTVTPAPEKVTRQVSLVPWSWGRGVRVSTEEFVVLELKEVRASDIQEKVGGVPCSQAQGTEQVRLLGWPAFRVPGIMMSGVRDRGVTCSNSWFAL